MRKILVILNLILFFNASGQLAMEVKTLTKEGVEYLEFSSNSYSKKFVNDLNNKFGYLQTYADKYREAPNESCEGLTVKEIIEKIKYIRENENSGSLASIGYDVTYNNNNLLSFDRYITPEGEIRVTNSTVSDYPYSFPVIYNLKEEKEIKNLEGFLTDSGIKEILKILKKVMYRRAIINFKRDSVLDCRIGQYTLEMFKIIPFKISNNSDDIDIFGAPDAIFFYFYFTDRGLEFKSNDLNHQCIICDGPNDHITIPWFELLPYCINSPENIILKIIKNSAVEVKKTQWIVKTNFAFVYDTPDEFNVEPTELVDLYIVKGEKVNSIAVCDDFLKVKYSTDNGKEIIGWVKIRDLE